MRVKTFTAMTEGGLDGKINTFLDGNSLDVIDIKYSSSIFLYGDNDCLQTINQINNSY